MTVMYANNMACATVEARPRISDRTLQSMPFVTAWKRLIEVRNIDPKY
eukprot:CAMPEP_0172701002 /NCGR_PEP_ID=MMETSP1074-20121228/31318_1 /TAXON_ID=2916 /ORGANISM="Ceratium fusus, Strain PA161109" /LENGTH=47 /DNA_ID= /DNA_START= /DNA_END= /DNA_ORIENTATION=